MLESIFKIIGSPLTPYFTAYTIGFPSATFMTKMTLTVCRLQGRDKGYHLFQVTVRREHTLALLQRIKMRTLMDHSLKPTFFPLSAEYFKMTDSFCISPTAG